MNERELAGGKTLQLMQDVNTMSLDKFTAEVLATEAQYERSDATLGGMGVGWMPECKSLLANREAMRVPVRSEAFAHVKENQQVWPARCRPLPDQFPRHPPIRRMLLEVTSPAIAPRIGAARDAEEKNTEME